MDGDFKTDITRDSFNITNILKASTQKRNFSRVLKQQGRVDLDADWNELVDILLYQQRTALTDIIGPHAGPADAVGFAIIDVGKPYTVGIGKGRYYVDGMLCDHFADDSCSIPEGERAEVDGNGEAHTLVYLDVWEREVTSLEDDAIRESALGGPDTATRAEVVFQVRFGDVSKLTKEPPTRENAGQFWTDLLRIWSLREYGQLTARTDPTVTSTDPCVTPPSSTYRGLENQLYRVEIHRSGTAYPDPPAGGQRGSSNRPSSSGSASKDSTQQTGDTGQIHATFKWSRENGSVAFLVVDDSLSISDNIITVTLKNLGPDDSRYSLQIGNWVELIDLSLVPNEVPGPLFQVETVNNATMEVTLTIAKGQTAPAESDLNGPFLLRRWDYKAGDPEDTANNDRPITIANDGAAMLIENHWLTLEMGVQIAFTQERNKKDPTYYRAGDYWLIPARIGTGELEWPFTIDTREQRQPDPLPPHGIVHHYAPLAQVTFNKDGGIVKADITELRRKIHQGWAAF
ncbi:MAG TPA: DUF6519 domain-containing protein [Ktedonobacteraceae bacterium]|nr:DUF6519 domain-containing protein [Ktedonobacteraceae bacterium]